MHTPALIQLLSLVVTGMTGGGACAVCKHQRRKCEPNCELAAYFPADRMNDFRALHLVFGVANLTKLIKANATEAARRRAAETLTWEARWRERDPSEGCYREIAGLRRENAVLRAENAALRRQAFSAYAGARVAAANSNHIPGSLVYNGNANPNNGTAGATMLVGYGQQDGHYLSPAADAGVARSDAAITSMIIRGDKNYTR